MARSKSNASFIARRKYTREYRQNHPLLQGRVPRSVYDECRRRARDVDFSLSKWLKYWLELTLGEHPRREDA